MIKSIFLAVLISTSACASNPGNRGSREVAKEPLRGGIAEFQVTSYDGEHFEGRILVGATIDPLVIDGRLNETSDVDVDVRTLRSCGKPGPFGYIQEDQFPPPPRPDQIITIRPGYWYGGTIRYFLFAKEEIGPDCIEADLVVRALDGRVAAKVPIHVVRTDKPPAPPEGRAPEAPAEPKPPAPDAGAP